jgi:hypothetical protein
VGFRIDHYDPQVSNPKSVAVYANLMWCCEHCNGHKSDLEPPDLAATHGHRFFRADMDDPGLHFELKGYRVAGLTPTGRFTEKMLYLNRKSLRRVREIRRRLYDSLEISRDGLRVLAGASLDRLSTKTRVSLLKERDRLASEREKLSDQVDEIIKLISSSDVLNDIEASEEEYKEMGKERRKHLKELRALFPGEWRGRER